VWGAPLTIVWGRFASLAVRGARTTRAPARRGEGPPDLRHNPASPPRDKIARSDFERAQRARRARRRDAPGKVGHCQAFISETPIRNGRGFFFMVSCLSVGPRGRIAGSDPEQRSAATLAWRANPGLSSGAGCGAKKAPGKAGRPQAFIPGPTTTCRRAFYRHLSAMACRPWNIG